MASKNETKQEEQPVAAPDLITISVKDTEMGMEFDQEIKAHASSQSAIMAVRDIYIKTLRKSYNAPESDYSFEGWARGFKKIEQPKAD